MKFRIIFSLLMSFTLALLMTCWVTWINLGWNHQFIHQWLTAFILAWPAAALISLVTAPFIQQLALALSGPGVNHKKQESS